MSSCSTGLVNIFSVRSISLSSLAGKPLTKRLNISSHRYVSCAQYSANSCSISGVNSARPSVLCTAFPLGGRPNSAASFAKLLPTSTPRRARPIESESKMNAGLHPYTHERMATSNCALCASTAVVDQSMASKVACKSLCVTHTVPGTSKVLMQQPNALNKLSRMYCSVVNLLSV